MKQTKPLDSDNAYSQVRRKIQGLFEFKGEDDRDDVLYAANKLNSVLRTVHENYLSWGRDAIKEFVLNQHDPLRYIKVKSDQFNRLVRTIQEEMIVEFS